MWNCLLALRLRVEEELRSEINREVSLRCAGKPPCFCALSWRQYHSSGVSMKKWKSAPDFNATWHLACNKDLRERGRLCLLPPWHDQKSSMTCGILWHVACGLSLWWAKHCRCQRSCTVHPRHQRRDHPWLTSDEMAVNRLLNRLQDASRVCLQGFVTREISRLFFEGMRVVESSNWD